MICSPGPERFRLLDAYVGWVDPAAAVSLGKQLVGLQDPRGLRLRGPEDDGIAPDVLSKWLPPPWFARGCLPCEWFLLAPQESRPGILRWDSCRGRWAAPHSDLSGAGSLRRPVAIAVDGDRLAVSDAGAGAVFVWCLRDGRLAARFDVEAPGPLALFGGEVVVASPWEPSSAGQGATARIARYGLAGDRRSPGIILDAEHPIRRLGRGADGALWAATGAPEGSFRLWRVTSEEPGPAEDAKPGHAPCCGAPERLVVERDPSVEDLAAASRPTGLVVANEDGFCLRMPGRGGETVVLCSTRDGKPARPGDVTPEPDTAETGRAVTFETGPLDSGIPRCRWHRVRIDADIPQGTQVDLSLATSEHPDERVADEDYEEIRNGTDALILDQPPGRYLRVRITLRGGPKTTPVLRRVRIDFPRSTSLDRLPTVYRDNPVAEDFTERFLAIFDATIADLDRAVATFPALLDAVDAPPEVLPWLAAMLGMAFDSSLDDRRRRELIRRAPELYRLRGTPAGLRLALWLLFDIDPAIIERPLGRAWGALGRDARLRSVRLFGKSRSRFRVGRSVLGTSPLRSHGDPDQDPFREGDHRFDVLLPPGISPGPESLAKLDRLISDQKPAHTAHALRVGGQGFVLGPRSAIGVDTRLSAPEPPVLGGGERPGNVRLDRASILRRGPRPRSGGLRVGRAAVGIHTVLE